MDIKELKEQKRLIMKQKAVELYKQMPEPTTRKVSELLESLYGIKRSHEWVAQALREVEK